MSDKPVFIHNWQYEIALLRLLSELPGGGGRTRDIYPRFEEKHKEQIPREHYEGIGAGNQPKWHNTLQWGRQYLVERGFVDGSKRGVWIITGEGRRWRKAQSSGAGPAAGARALLRRE